MDRFASMSTLLAIVQTGSLSAASRRLGTPLATVSRRISDLEAHLGTRLLNRSNRSVTLTDAGAGYVESCRRILAEVEAAERTVSGEYQAPRGELVVTAPMVLGRVHVLPVASAFLAAYPDIVLRLRLSDRAFNLHEEHVDVGVRLGNLPDTTSLVARRIGAVHQVICASPDYLARRGTPSTPDDLHQHDCVTFLGLQRADAWNVPGGAPVPVRSRLLVDNAEAVVDAAVEGTGIACVFSYQAAAAVRAGRLTRLLRGYEPPPLPVNIIHLAEGLIPLKLRAFLDFAAPLLRERLAADLS